MKKLIVCLALLGAATCFAETFQGQAVIPVRAFLEEELGCEVGHATGNVGTVGGAPAEYYIHSGYRVYNGCFTGRVALHHFQGVELYEFHRNRNNKNYWLALPTWSKGLNLGPVCH